MKRIGTSALRFASAWTSLLLFLAGAALAFQAENAAADISGKVYEGRLNAGALQPIQGARVIVRDTTSVRSDTTDVNGFYAFTGDVAGCQLLALADSHWSAIKENLVNDVECYVILPTRVGDLTEQKSLGIRNNRNNGVLMYQRTLIPSEPIAVYFDSSQNSWSTTEKQLVLDWMASRNALFAKDLWVEVPTKRMDYGINLVLDYDGYNHTSISSLDYSDPYNFVIKLATITLTSANYQQIIDKEFISLPPIGLDVPSYVPTCVQGDEVSGKDIQYYNPIDDFRPVYLKVRTEHPGTQITSMLELTDSTPTAVEDPLRGDAPGIPLTILSISPNPFNPSTELSFESRRSGQVNMEIYDVSGRCVRTVQLGILGSGLHRARWNGRDMSGHNASSGIYFVRLRSADGESRPVKAVLMR